MDEFPWEDGLLERKTEAYDDEAFLKTIVAFANSVRPEHTAIILIGERDNGKIVGVIDPDKFQMRLHKIAKQIYPAIVWRSQIYEKDGKHCVRVEINYSGETPHFGGIAWVRKGSETVKATDEVFQRLIDLRSSKVRELAKWLDKEITIIAEKSRPLPNHRNYLYFLDVSGNPMSERESFTLKTVNNFWITIQDKNKDSHSEPIDRVQLSFDNEKNRLFVIIKY